MAKNGILKIYLAHVMLGINGMDNYVKNLMIVQMEEYGILCISSVSALMALTGLVIIVSLSKNVLEDSTLIQLFLNVYAYQDLNGMEKLVSNATMGKFGMLLH